MKNGIVRNKNQNFSYVSMASQYKKENLYMYMHVFMQISMHEHHIAK